jgi:hypothetical protein
MHRKHHHRPAAVAGALLLAGLLALPAAGLAQLGGVLPSPSLPLPTPTASASTVTGQATVAQVVLLGLLGTATSTSLASTGISGTNAESDVAQVAGSIPSLLGAEVLNATTYSYPDQVDSTASLANLGLSVAGITISADSVVAEASQALGAAGTATSYIDNLAINGVPVSLSGAPNQTISIPGGQVVLNEQTIASDGSTVVNAIHVTVNGVADVVIASATAGVS